MRGAIRGSHPIRHCVVGAQTGAAFRCSAGPARRACQGEEVDGSVWGGIVWPGTAKIKIKRKRESYSLAKIKN